MASSVSLSLSFGLKHRYPQCGDNENQVIPLFKICSPWCPLTRVVQAVSAHLTTCQKDECELVGHASVSGLRVRAPRSPPSTHSARESSHKSLLPNEHALLRNIETASQVTQSISTAEIRKAIRPMSTKTDCPSRVTFSRSP